MWGGSAAFVPIIAKNADPQWSSVKNNRFVGGDFIGSRANLVNASAVERRKSFKDPFAPAIGKMIVGQAHNVDICPLQRMRRPGRNPVGESAVLAVSLSRQRTFEISADDGGMLKQRQDSGKRVILAPLPHRLIRPVAEHDVTDANDRIFGNIPFGDCSGEQFSRQQVRRSGDFLHRQPLQSGRQFEAFDFGCMVDLPGFVGDYLALGEDVRNQR